MSGTKAGSLKTRDTNYQRYGKDYYREIGRKGGLQSTPTGGFGSNHKLAREMGRKMGYITKRGYKFLEEKDGYRYYRKKSTGDIVKFEKAR